MLAHLDLALPEGQQSFWPELVGAATGPMRTLLSIVSEQAAQIATLEREAGALRRIDDGGDILVRAG
ncbi:hypothetical protein, partial [Stenotrophomonas sp. 3(2025)]|uniref:hypothetical protein n=1 Tax=Stenotrophomonas sp. 3(2025) TaxID=3456023 RepID=UPI0040447CD4